MKVTVFEVGPRDGLQNEKISVSLEQRVCWILGLLKTGIRHMEIGAFVRADRVSQMKDTDALFQVLWKKQSLRPFWKGFFALVPNEKGFLRAQASHVQSIAVFMAASETFHRNNLGCSIKESFLKIRRIVSQAKAEKRSVRGYVSTAFGCPFEGKVAPKKVIEFASKLLDLGVDQVSLGDTIGVAGPRMVERILKPLFHAWPVKKIALHFHDTRGMALVNVLRALDLGARVFDASSGGLGGCPFAPGATGNLAMEDLLYLLGHLKVESGIDLEMLCKVNLDFYRSIGKKKIAGRFLLSYAKKKHLLF